MSDGLENSRYHEEDGLYITASQLKFFLNDKKSWQQYKNRTKAFLRYLNECKLYNFISDYMEIHPGSAYLVWDEHFQEFVFSISRRGKIFKELEKLGLGDK